MAIIIARADARHLPLPDKSVDLVVTSPPYWAQRSYTDGGTHYEGQLGGEITPQEWVDNLIAVTRECVRVLRPTGSIWINLGDKYSSPGGHTDNTASSRLDGRPNLRKQGRADRNTATHGVAAKSLFGLPWRYAIRCIDDLRLILRAEVIWSKPSAIPESVTDRVRRSHETWFHFTTQPRYFAAVDEIREPSDPRSLRPSDVAGHVSRKDATRRSSRCAVVGHADRALAFNPLGRLPGSVWDVSAQPLNVPDELGVEHYAAFPVEWPRRLILGWSPSAYCTACDQPRRVVYDRAFEVQDDCSVDTAWRRDKHYAGNNWRTVPRGASRVNRVGHSCGCPDTSAPTRPAVVLDPFGGTGTTALAADVLGRTGVSIDRSADYCRIAAWRTADPGERAKALGAARPPVEAAGQGDLLAEFAQGMATTVHPYPGPQVAS
jgi:DNA modification methylase